MKINGWTKNVALESFSKYKLYSYLEKEETKVWKYSAYMLAQLFNDEHAGALHFPKV